jgi:hypothetical protein
VPAELEADLGVGGEGAFELHDVHALETLGDVEGSAGVVDGVVELGNAGEDGVVLEVATKPEGVGREGEGEGGSEGSDGRRGHGGTRTDTDWHGLTQTDTDGGGDWSDGTGGGRGGGLARGARGGGGCGEEGLEGGGGAFAEVVGGDDGEDAEAAREGDGFEKFAEGSTEVDEETSVAFGGEAGLGSRVEDEHGTKDGARALRERDDGGVGDAREGSEAAFDFGESDALFFDFEDAVESPKEDEGGGVGGEADLVVGGERGGVGEEGGAQGEAAFGVGGDLDAGEGRPAVGLGGGLAPSDGTGFGAAKDFGRGDAEEGGGAAGGVGREDAASREDVAAGAGSGGEGGEVFVEAFEEGGAGDEGEGARGGEELFVGFEEGGVEGDAEGEGEQDAELEAVEVVVRGGANDVGAGEA